MYPWEQLAEDDSWADENGNYPYRPFPNQPYDPNAQTAAQYQSARREEEARWKPLLDAVNENSPATIDRGLVEKIAGEHFDELGDEHEELGLPDEQEIDYVRLYDLVYEHLVTFLNPDPFQGKGWGAAAPHPGFAAVSELTQIAIDDIKKSDRRLREQMAMCP